MGRWSSVSVGSAIYGAVLLLIGMLLALLRVYFRQSELRETIAELYSYYKYGVGCIFLIELLFSRMYEARNGWPGRAIRPQSHANGETRGHDGSGKECDEVAETSGHTLAYCHVGSFYLRMGILVFGSVAVIQHCMRGFVEYIEGGGEKEFAYSWTKEPMIAVFTMLQMVLVFNFSISRLPQQTMIESYGFMHVLVVDILKWVRSAVDEYNHLSKEHHGHGGGEGGHSGGEAGIGAGEESERHKRAATAAINAHSTAASDHAGGVNEYNVDNEIFGEYSAVVGAFNTEFLIATAAVLFIVWLNINRLVDADHRWKAAVEGHVRRKKTIRITIGRRFTGLFLGVLLSIFLSLGILIHAYYRASGLGRAKWAIEVSNGGAYIAMIGACIVGMVVMRESLDGKWDIGLSGAKDELLDRLLLFVGVGAEVLYCGAAIIGAISGEILRHKISSSVGFLLRLAQVFLQLHLIMDLNGAHHSGGRTPGRQTILFLLWANLSLFFYYCVQTIHSVFTTTVIGQMPFPYKPVIALALPFVLFYRFHSSAVLADIYKHHCGEPNAAKKHQHGHTLPQVHHHHQPHHGE